MKIRAGILAGIFLIVLLMGTALAEDFTVVSDENTGFKTYSIKEGITDGTLGTGDNLYFHVTEGSYIKSYGNNHVFEADLTTSRDLKEPATFVFEGQSIQVPANTHITYKDGVIHIDEQSKSFSFSYASNQEDTPIIITTEKKGLLDIGKNTKLAIKDGEMRGDSFTLTEDNGFILKVKALGFIGSGLDSGGITRLGKGDYRSFHSTVIFDNIETLNAMPETSPTIVNIRDSDIADSDIPMDPNFPSIIYSPNEGLLAYASGPTSPDRQVPTLLKSFTIQIYEDPNAPDTHKDFFIGARGNAAYSLNTKKSLMIISNTEDSEVSFHKGSIDFQTNLERGFFQGRMQKRNNPIPAQSGIYEAGDNSEISKVLSDTISIIAPARSPEKITIGSNSMTVPQMGGMTFVINNEATKE